ADADRESRTCRDPGGRAPGEGELPLLRAEEGPRAPFLHRQLDRVRAVPRRERLRLVTRHVALLGHPVSHSLSPLMQNAAFAAGGVDWHYSAVDGEDGGEGGRALRA